MGVFWRKKYTTSSKMPWGAMELHKIELNQGLTRKGLAKNPSLIPLHFCTVAGTILALGYLTRLSTKNPDCCWDKAGNPYPWQKLGVNGQYKFWCPTPGYYARQKVPEERPDID